MKDVLKDYKVTVSDDMTYHVTESRVDGDSIRIQARPDTIPTVSITTGFDMDDGYGISEPEYPKDLFADQFTDELVRQVIQLHTSD